MSHRPTTHSENLRILRARLSDHLSPAEANELEEAARALADGKDAERGPLKLDDDRRVFFYEQDHYYLSNFSAFSLIWKGNYFTTSEAAYQWEKFPHLPEVQTAIKAAPSAHEAFKIAEANSYRKLTDWMLDEVKVAVMRDILRAKAEQHEYVRRKLLETGDRELIENSWRDDFWGWGQNRDGKNMLGRLWMEIRAAMREEPRK